MKRQPWLIKQQTCFGRMVTWKFPKQQLFAVPEAIPALMLFNNVSDTTLAKDALDFSLNSAPQAPFSLVQLTEFYFSSHELNSARLSLV